MKKILILTLFMLFSIASYSYEVLLTVSRIDEFKWEVSVELSNNKDDFTAFQIDVETYGDDCFIEQFNKGALLSKHTLTIGSPDNHFRLIAHNNSNQVFSCKEGSILSFQIKGQFDSISVKNIQFVDLNAIVLPSKEQTYIIQNDKTSIDNVPTRPLSQNTFDIYKINGMKVNVGRNGIYIINNKKILLK